MRMAILRPHVAWTGGETVQVGNDSTHPLVPSAQEVRGRDLPIACDYR